MLVIVETRWWVHGDSSLSPTVSPFGIPFSPWPSGITCKVFLSLLRPFLRPCLSPWLHSPFTYITPIIFISISLWWHFPFFHLFLFHLHSYSEIGFTRSSSFTINSLPIIRVHSPFQHFVCVDSWAVTTLRDTYQNFQIPQSLLDQSFKYCWEKPPLHTCALL